MRILIGRIVSLLIAAAMVVSMVVEAGGLTPEVAQNGALLLLPLGMIWFSEALGSYTGYIGHGEVTAETPPILIWLAGWFFLVGLPIIVYFWH